jgi:hypothetical protein
MIRDVIGHKYFYEGIITALSVGGLFIILGFVFVFTPGIAGQTSSFINDFGTQTYPLSSTSTLSLPAPTHPDNHMGFYSAVINFFIGVGVLQIIILALRLLLHSRIRRIAQSIGDLIFWLGAAFVGNIFLLAGTIDGWFQFWSLLIVLIGLSLIARFFVYLVGRPRKPNRINL